VPDRFVVALQLTLLVAWLGAHVALVMELARRTSRKEALRAFLLVPMAPGAALRAGLRGAALRWLALAAGYGLTVVWREGR
jgi:hypothetical protein